MAVAFEQVWAPGSDGRYRIMGIRMTGGLANGEQDTGIDLPARAVLLGPPILDVTTAEATGGTKTLDVGLLSSESGGDANGFFEAVSVAATGLKIATPTVTVGGTETYYSANTVGALVRAGYIVGTNVDQDYGLFAPKQFLTDSVTAKSVSVSTPNAFTEFAGVLWFPMIILDF